jgi:hypothetical protein
MSRKVAIMPRSRRRSCNSRIQMRRWSAVAGAAAFVGATAGFTSIAGAATPMVPHAHPDGVSAGTYLAGYQVTPSGGVASASATFTIPKFTCTKKDDTDGAEFDLGVYTDDFHAWSWINAACGSSGVSYYYFLGSPSGQLIQPAKAGDTVVTSLSQSATTTYTKIHDLTNGQYWFDEGANTADETIVDVGSLNYFPSLPLPTFSKATLSNATVNGDYLGLESPTGYNALDGGVTLVKTGPLSTNAAGSSFAVTFEHGS